MDSKSVVCAQAIATVALVGITGYYSFRSLLVGKGKRYNAAKSIQKWVRGLKILTRLHEKEVSATKIEEWWRTVSRKDNLLQAIETKNEQNQKFAFSLPFVTNAITNLKQLLITGIIADWWRKSTVNSETYADNAEDILIKCIEDVESQKKNDVEEIAKWWQTVVDEYRLSVKDLPLDVGCECNVNKNSKKEFGEPVNELKIKEQVPTDYGSHLRCLEVSENKTNNIDIVNVEILENQESKHLQPSSCWSECASSSYRKNSSSESSTEGSSLVEIPLKKCSPVFSLFGENAIINQNEKLKEVEEFSEPRIEIIQDFKFNSLSESSDNEFKDDILQARDNFGDDDFFKSCTENNEMRVESIYSQHPFGENISIEHTDLEKEIASKKLQKFWRITREKKDFQMKLAKISHISITTKKFLLRRKLMVERDFACLKLQTLWRMIQAKQNYHDLYKSAVICISAGKGFLMRKRYYSFFLLAKKKKTCRKLQIWWKNLMNRKTSIKIILLQALGRGFLQQKLLKQKLRENYISKLSEQYEEETANIMIIQKVLRCCLTWFEVKGDIMEMSKVSIMT
ncbi:uncharacterized protein LOC111635259 [Centruroides sculpturatus]|uniref:uncharacterized protein LOC111635259 n=1 Tax=Centruroides sculpturatus TaxID=218467 RepID=UPI000C6D27DF|nr:uncharacterized protein LOC111635259 [Centruroides sculpturatus]